MRSRLVVVAVAAGLALGAAACSDDDGGGGEASTQEADGATTTTAAAGLSTAACDAYVALSQAVANVPEGPDAGAFIESEALPQIQILADEAPDELADAGQTMLEIGTAAVDDPAQFDDPDAEAAYLEYGGAVHTGCGFESVDVSAVEYEYQGLPESASPGTTSIALTNDGTEQHEMVLFRRQDGDTRPIEEVLALPEDEAEQSVTFTGATFAEPGDTGFLTADLGAGSYVAVCFVPVGGAEDGPPHFTQGMVSEFEVA
jgi:hypothetical protein